MIALALAPAACSKSGTGDTSSPTGPTSPPAAGSSIVYTAVGASDVIGFGSTRVCLPFEDCDGQGYVWVAARQLRTQGFRVDVAQLGIPAAVISRTFQDLGTQNGQTIGGNMVQQEMPFVRRDTNLVTVFVGANDINTVTAAVRNGLGGSDPNGYIDRSVSAFGVDFTTLISGIRGRAPNARIVVINVPNLAGMPYLAGVSLSQKQAAQRAAVKITTTILNTAADVRVVDLMCDPRMYQASIFSADGFHPNDSGYAVIGEEVAKAAAASYPAPRASCSQMTLF